MIEGKLKKRIDDVIEEDLGIDPATIDVNIAIADQVNLDSMQFVGLIAKLEMELNAELPISIMQVRTLKEFYGEIETAIGRKNAL